MAMMAEGTKIDGGHLLESLEAAKAKLGAGESDVVLDFSSVERLNAASLSQLSELAALASEKSARIGLRSVNVDVYRVLKAARIASQLIFLS